MSRLRFATASLLIMTSASITMAQRPNDRNRDPKQIAERVRAAAAPAGGAITVSDTRESKDLKHLKQGKWIVVNVKRDGDTIPAQFGQKVGDVITIDMVDDSAVFG